MRKRKRYYTAHQIIREIEYSRKRLDHHLAVASALDIEADHLFKAGPAFCEDAGLKREQARKRRRSAYRIETNRLPFLKGKLAEFNTYQLPGVDNGDPSISPKG